MPTSEIAEHETADRRAACRNTGVLLVVATAVANVPAMTLGHRCWAHLRVHAQTVSQAGRMPREGPDIPLRCDMIHPFHPRCTSYGAHFSSLFRRRTTRCKIAGKASTLLMQA